jgi:hypothetical protein
MMGSLLDVAVRRAGEGGFDKPMAALAGAGAAALVFLMPVDVLQNLVLDSGLPSILPAAEPPLGLKARALLAVLAGVVVFVGVYGVMRLLGRKPARAPRPTPWVAEELPPMPEPAPRMRRRDLHPDAPVRAPISALRDFGEPYRDEDDGEPALVLTEFLPEAPAPTEPEEEEELVLTEAIAEPAPAPVPEVAPERAAEPVARTQNEPTIAELLARLEQALEKKPLPQWLDREEAAKPQPPVAAADNEDSVEPMDVRLRSALENLKRFAPAHG